ncbi:MULTISPECIES: hypothetical protein [Sorangium]|uniref:Secreted protein n=1 Tax=Sorangium cellulosum TaxID=56 RepID=A0A4P2QXJ6_SORCE|nr:MULTISPECIES: hypothetical protein [Sorangium]AUX34906.1 hypothetical protein SOCE836_070850 [Sorangium cellulosum]WCQ94212.1 hypothetical protein NQZ70_06969 [Sorangium sp. Soce836]
MGGALVALLASLALAAPCFADERSPITVVAGARGALAHRLSQELEAAGLPVQVEASPAAAAPGGLLIVVPEGDEGAIEIWSASGGRADLVASVAPDGPLDTRVLRAAELVRALRSAADAPAGATPAPLPPAPVAPAPLPPAPVAPPAAGSGQAWWGRPLRAWAPPPPAFPVSAAPRAALVDVGVAVAVGWQTPGVSLALDASLRLWPSARVGVGLLADLPLVGPTIDAPEGEVGFRATLLGAELVLAPVARTGRFGLVLSPGVGLAHVSASGEARPPYLDSDESTFTALVYGRGEARLRLIDSLALTAGALGGAAIPPVDLRFVGRVTSTFCPLASFSLGVVVER